MQDRAIGFDLNDAEERYRVVECDNPAVEYIPDLVESTSSKRKSPPTSDDEASGDLTTPERRKSARLKEKASRVANDEGDSGQRGVGQGDANSSQRNIGMGHASWIDRTPLSSRPDHSTLSELFHADTRI